MRKIDLNRIMIGDIEYPLYCDLYVLSKIQDRMSINQFERDILGAKILKDENGESIRDDDGSLKLVFDKYNIETILFGLNLMINEGLEIESEQEGKDFEPVTEKDIARSCTLPLEHISDIIHKEFNRCFEFKKKQPSKTTTRKRKTTQ